MVSDLGFVATKYYPPKSNGDLRNLHKTIVESGGTADTPKISVLYYLLLELDYPTGKREYSTALEQNAFLPAKYQIYMKGLWHLDRKEFEVCIRQKQEEHVLILCSWLCNTLHTLL